MTSGLLLDEMLAPVIGRTLRGRGHDVVSVAEDPELRALSDHELYARASADNRWIVTENVADFQSVLRAAEHSNAATAGVLFTSSRTFPRTRGNPGPLIAALDAWLRSTAGADLGAEQWLSSGG